MRRADYGSDSFKLCFSERLCSAAMVDTLMVSRPFQTTPKTPWYKIAL